MPTYISIIVLSICSPHGGVPPFILPEVHTAKAVLALFLGGLGYIQQGAPFGDFRAIS